MPPYIYIYYVSILAVMCSRLNIIYIVKYENYSAAYVANNLITILASSSLDDFKLLLYVERCVQLMFKIINLLDYSVG